MEARRERALDAGDLRGEGFDNSESAERLGLRIDGLPDCVVQRTGDRRKIEHSLVTPRLDEPTTETSKLEFRSSNRLGIGQWIPAFAGNDGFDGNDVIPVEAGIYLNRFGPETNLEDRDWKTPEIRPPPAAGNGRGTLTLVPDSTPSTSLFCRSAAVNRAMQKLRQWRPAPHRPRRRVKLQPEAPRDEIK